MAVNRAGPRTATMQFLSHRLSLSNSCFISEEAGLRPFGRHPHGRVHSAAVCRAWVVVLPSSPCLGVGPGWRSCQCGQAGAGAFGGRLPLPPTCWGRRGRGGQAHQLAVKTKPSPQLLISSCIFLALWHSTVLFHEYGYFCHSVAPAWMKCGRWSQDEGSGDGRLRLEAAGPGPLGPAGRSPGHPER